ncbi:MAG: hypothetical protein E5X92_22695, partial [Mesorhizobium sp.]
MACLIIAAGKQPAAMSAIQDCCMDDVVLSLEGVGKIFPGVVALSDVSLSIARGETHIVLG